MRSRDAGYARDLPMSSIVADFAPNMIHKDSNTHKLVLSSVSFLHPRCILSHPLDRFHT